MYSSIDNLVYHCGQTFIVDLLPSLFTKIDTSSAQEKEAIMDFDYNGSLLSTMILLTMRNSISKILILN